MNDLGQANDVEPLLEEAVEDYWITYRQYVHILLAWGYADSLPRVQINNEKEPNITGSLPKLSRIDLMILLVPVGVNIFR